MSDKQYTLRVTIKVQGDAPIDGLKTPRAIEFDGIEISVKAWWPHLTFTAANFSSEQDAEHFMERMKHALFSIALDWNFGFIPNFRRNKIRWADAEENEQRSDELNTDTLHKRYDGFCDEEGYVVFENNKNIRFSSIIAGHASVSSPWEGVEKSVIRGLSNRQPDAVEPKSALGTAIELYLASFYESSYRARFLTLMTCFEALAPKARRHSSVVSSLAEFKQAIENKVLISVDEEEKKALQDLLGEISFKKETAIGRKIYNLIMTQEDLSEEKREQLANNLAAAYKFRGRLARIMREG